MSHDYNSVKSNTHWSTYYVPDIFIYFGSHKNAAHRPLTAGTFPGPQLLCWAFLRLHQGLKLPQFSSLCPFLGVRFASFSLWPSASSLVPPPSSFTSNTPNNILAHLISFSHLLLRGFRLMTHTVHHLILKTVLWSQCYLSHFNYRPRLISKGWKKNPTIYF